MDISQTNADVRVGYQDFSDFAQLLKNRICQKPRKLHPALAYTPYGSELFAKLSEQPEYYLPKIEKKLLRERIKNIIEISNPAAIIDLGCGNMAKTQIVINEAVIHNNLKLYPCDIDSSIVENGISYLNYFYQDNLEVTPFIGDMLKTIKYFEHYNFSKLFTFFGSTYGNLPENSKYELVNTLKKVMLHKDKFLIGVDLVKDSRVLEATYNDKAECVSKGIFEMLNSINCQFGSNFDLDKFQHSAIFESKSRSVVSYVISLEDQVIEIPGLDITIYLEKGEKIEAERYQKFVLSEILEFIQSFGLRPVKIEVDDEIPYALLLFSGPKDNAPAVE